MVLPATILSARRLNKESLLVGAEQMENRRAARKWLATAPSERAFSLRRSAQHHTHTHKIL
jgi:hypothetical protein